jgi:hypothetical protein
VADQTVAELARDLVLELLDLLALELDDRAAARVDQMVVMLVRRLLVARPAVAEVVPLQDAGLLEQADRAIDRGDGDLRIDGVRPAVQLLDVRVVRSRRRAPGR